MFTIIAAYTNKWGLKMTKSEKIKLYIEPVLSGSHDKKSVNKWLKQDGIKINWKTLEATEIAA